MSRTEPDDASRRLLDAFRDYLRREEWTLAFEDDEERATAVAVEADSGRWLCVVQGIEGYSFVVFSSIIPTFVPLERRPAVGEFLHRANAGMLLGGFQFAWDQGEIRFVTSLDLTGVELADSRGDANLDAMFHQIVYANVTAVDRYMAALLTVIVTDADPAAAVEQAERV